MKISEGVIIDHLPPWSAPGLLALLRLKERSERLYAALNVPSTRMGCKDILWIQAYWPDPADFFRIQVVAPEATLVFVEKGVKTASVCPVLPEMLEQLVLCSNPRCITRVEEVPHKVKVLSQDELAFQCHYCQTRFDKKELQFA